MRGAAAALALLLAACDLPPFYRCTSDANCVRSGQAGICTPAGGCAFSDGECLSQRRYAHFSDAALADRCYAPDFCRPDAEPCATLGAEVCDDFEGGALQPGWLDHSNGFGRVALDGARACRGAQSVRFDVDAPAGATAPQAILDGFRDLPSPVYVRAFYYFGDPPLLNNNTGIVFIAGNGDGTSIVIDNVKNGTQDSPRVAINNYLSGMNGPITPSHLAIETGRWICIELSVESHPDLSGQVRVWIDDVEVPDLNLVSGTPTVAGFPGRFDQYTLLLGTPNTSSAAEKHSLWIDALVIDQQRIGCQR
jgi:hypothetical protein